MRKLTVAVGLFKQGPHFLKCILVGIGLAIGCNQVVLSNGLGVTLLFVLLLHAACKNIAVIFS